MTLALSDDEMWTFLDGVLTGILTTLRSDGFPVALPVWFVVIDRQIYVRTARESLKVRRILHDDRAGFLVESGEHWADLRCVSMTARAVLLDDEPLKRRVMAARATKYRGRGTGDDVPSATVRHYARESAIIRLTPIGRPVSWDNGRVRRSKSSTTEATESQVTHETMKGY